MTYSDNKLLLSHILHRSPILPHNTHQSQQPLILNHIWLFQKQLNLFIDSREFFFRTGFPQIVQLLQAWGASCLSVEELLDGVRVGVP